MAATMYLRTVALDSPVPVAICRWLLPDCQRRTTSAISTLDTSLYAVANPAPRVVKPPGEVVYRSWRSPLLLVHTSWRLTKLPHPGRGSVSVQLAVERLAESGRS